LPFCSYFLTYLLTPWCRFLLEKLTGLQLVKKFPAFYGTRRFITARTSVRQLSLSWASPIQSTYPHPTSYFQEINPNIIHPSTPRSPQWSLSLRFPYQDPIRPPSPHPCAPHAQPISFFSILSPAQYWVRSTNHLAMVMQSPPFPRYLVPPRSKYQHHVLKHPQLPFLPQCQRQSFTPI